MSNKKETFSKDSEAKASEPLENLEVCIHMDILYRRTVSSSIRYNEVHFSHNFVCEQ